MSSLLSNNSAILGVAGRDMDVSAETRQRIQLESDISLYFRAHPARTHIQASSLAGIQETATLLNLDFYRWAVPTELFETGISEAIEHLLQELLECLLSDPGAGFPSRSTLIHLPIYDIVEAHQTAFAEREMFLIGDYPIITQLPNDEGIITGYADMVICYETGLFPSTNLSKRTTAVILQAKNCVNTYQGPAQAAAYMVGMHQKRVLLDPSSATDITTYGIVSNGIDWQFMKFNENKIRASGIFSMTEASDRRIVYHFVHEIVKGSIAQVPIHTDS